MDALYFLQHYWWALVSLLGAILVFLLFVQGAQGLLFNVAKSKEEKDFIVKYAGHKWEMTFTTLVTFGGAAFASFPLFYSTSFGGAYWLWFAILFCFVIQAVSFEFRDDAGNIFGAKAHLAKHVHQLIVFGMSGVDCYQKGIMRIKVREYFS